MNEVVVLITEATVEDTNCLIDRQRFLIIVALHLFRRSDTDQLQRQSGVWNCQPMDFGQPDLSYSCFRQSLETFLFGQWDRSVIRFNLTSKILFLTYLLTYCRRGFTPQAQSSLTRLIPFVRGEDRKMSTKQVVASSRKC